MRLHDPADYGHLTYCTNIHAGADWPDMISGLRKWVPSIKRAVAADRQFGLGLRIAATAATSLSRQGKLADLQRFLDETGCYVFTINGFPYGPFHGQAVKEQVYAPDWQTSERLAYTNTLADVLAQLLPDGVDGSISTVPGSFKAWSKGREAIIAEALIGHVAHLVDIKRRTGHTIRLALEPEPCCMLETIAETVAFFRDYVFARSAVQQLTAEADIAPAAAEAALRDHIGVCYDVCHAAVEYENAAESIVDLRRAEILIPKLQLSSALRIAAVDSGTATALAPFNEAVYLHQVIARAGGDPQAQLKRYVDLPDALAAAGSSEGEEWRVHFHVPIFIEDLSHFGTTQFFLREILALHRDRKISEHLEVETYTWDVLPEDYRGENVASAISRELNWVISELSGVATA